MKTWMTTLGLALFLLLDVAPCGSCGNNRPVDRDPEKLEQIEADEAAAPDEASAEPAKEQ